MLNKPKGYTKSQASCSAKHKCKTVDCTEGVVYKIPLACGKSDIAQKGEKYKRETNTLVTLALSTVIESTRVDSIAIGHSYTATPTVIEPVLTDEFNRAPLPQFN